MDELQHKGLLNEEEISLYFTVEGCFLFALFCTGSGKLWAGNMCYACLKYKFKMPMFFAYMD